MGHSTLETMQKIEAAAQAILDDYHHQALESKKSLDEDLANLEAKLNQEIEQELASQKNAVKEELSALKLRVEEEKIRDTSRVQAVLTDKKSQLVKGIVDKVVESYGH